MAEIYLSLGSNIDDRQKFLGDALTSLQRKVKLNHISSTYRTKPWGNTNQPDFLNICVSGGTSLKPSGLLKFIKEVESNLGRKHSEKWGPREIDIDILFYEDQVLKLPDLEIPHPYLAERAFVLIPLAEIAPSFKHPAINKSVSELALSIDSKGVEKVDNE